MKYAMVPCLLCVVLLSALAHSQETRPAIPESFVGKWQDPKNQEHYLIISPQSITWHRAPAGFTDTIPAGACKVNADEVTFSVKSAEGTLDPRTGKVLGGSAHATMLRQGDTLAIREIPVQDFSGLPTGFAVTPLPKFHVFRRAAG
ncbi:MAG: hypothetical protein AB1646_20205 [Thermodesulfobacteriota bacterium]